MNELTGALPAHLMAEKTEVPTAKNQMGKDDFMKLLLTQLRYQDPLNPMDHKEMSAQLAQFSSLEQLSNIGSGIKNLRSGMGEDAKLQAVGLIGRQIKVAGNEVDLVEGQPVTLKLEPKADVDPVKAVIVDSGGKQVRELTLTKKDAGEVQWDGKMSDGMDAPPGRYAFRVQGVDKNGQGREMTSEMNGKVTGLDMSGASPMLLVQTSAGQTRVELTKVKHITMQEEGPSGPPSRSGAPAVPAELTAARARELVAEAAAPEGEEKSWRGMGGDAASRSDRFGRYPGPSRP